MNNKYINKKVILSSYPVGLAKKNDFSVVTEEIDTLNDNEILVKTKYIGIDAALRLLLRDSDDFLFRVKKDDLIRGSIVGEVIESKNPKFSDGEYVLGSLGVQKYCVSNGEGIEKCDLNLANPELWLSGMGLPGLTAYFSLLDVCKPSPDKNVLIIGAAGAVGSIAGQIAKLAGSKVIGTTSSDEKCKWLIEELGYDHAINYKNKDWFEELSAVSDKRLDIIFDNTGGQVMDESLKIIGMKGIVLLCGSTSQYSENEIKGPNNYIWLGTMRARLQGFVIFDYEDRYEEARINLSKWLNEEKLKMPTHLVEGDIDKFPEIFEDLYKGKNYGKFVLKLND